MQNDLHEILKAREAFSKEIREKYAEAFSRLNDVYDLCRSLAAPVQYADTDPQKYFKDILQETMLRAANRIQSLSILLQIGNSSEAATVLRSIFEDLLTIKYIGQIPILRSLVFTRYILKQRIETLQRKNGPAKNVAPVNDYVWAVKSLEAEIKKVAPTFHFTDGRQWSGRTSHDMARDTRLDKEFAFVYGDLSDRAYSLELPMLYPQDIDSGIVAENAAFYSMEILRVYVSCIRSDKVALISRLSERLSNRKGA